MATVEVKFKISKVKAIIDKFMSDLSVISGKEVRAIMGIMRSRRKMSPVGGLAHKKAIIKKITAERPALSANKVARMIRRKVARSLASKKPLLTLNTEPLRNVDGKDLDSCFSGQV